MATPTEGRTTVDYLLGRGRLERIDGSTAGESAATIIGRAARPLRRTRHAAQYFDPSSAEISRDDAAWALTTSRGVVEAVERLLGTDPPELFA